MRYFLIILLASSLIAGTYTDSYVVTGKKSSTTELDSFMYGDFKEIIRFDMLKFEDGEFIDSNENNTIYKNILKSISNYTQKGEEFHIKIIGHSNNTSDNVNELATKSDTYVDKITGLLTYSFDENTSQIQSKGYATYIQDTLVADDVQKELITVEYRAGKDMLFSDNTRKSRELSDRVMVSIYLIQKKKQIIKPKLQEIIEEEVIDEEVMYEEVMYEEVIDEDVIDDSDKDFDGIQNEYDDCTNTPLNTKVSADGCSHTETLKVHFATNQSIIYPYSYVNIEKFAIFLTNNPTYNIEIIGHTDNKGTADSNLLLSQNRAISTKNALISEGVEESRIVTQGKGELFPLLDNLTERNMQANRRIEVKIYNNK